ncbi:MAG: efflux RND transporter periplasmic adaptor subunit [Rhodospirillaceae bacterium]|nr:efflux RND transporter periplasmic adaptor subunit [Rhodospirillaceae bacterium]
MAQAKRRGFGGWLLGPGKYLFGVVIVAAAGWYWYARDEAAAARPAYRLAKVERGTIANTVTASGTLKALITVDVGTQISGQIKQLSADFNTEVKAGQVIARLDPASFEAKVKEAEADLATAKSNVVLMQARLDGMRADTAQAKSAMTLAKLDLDRKRELLPSKAIAQSTYDQAVANHDQAVSKYQGTLAKEAEQKATIDVALAQVKQKEATLTQRRIDLDNTYIRSPVDGVVIARNVDVGQTVAASLQSPILFTIAQDLKQMQVEVNVDEADIGRIREGLIATFTVDSFPGHTFPGKVRQVRKAPKEVSSVITYTVVVSTQNPDLRLLPGMTANVTFQIQRRENTLTIPNAALRFRPAGARPERAAQPGGTTSRQGNPQARMEQQIEALKKELALTKEQEQQVRGIYRDMGQRLRQLRGSGTPFDQLREELAKLRKGAEDRIAALLTPEQKVKYDEMRGVAGDSGPRRATVYVLGPDGQPKRVAIIAGITDGSNTELVSGDLKPGDQVIVGLDTRGGAPSGNQRRPRFGL